MAGRVKHMKRSHRSYGKNQSEFGRFEARAYSVKSAKKSRKDNLFSRAVSSFKNIFGKGDR